MRPSDFDTRQNFDYKKTGLPVEDRRGRYPYYLPIGWYRHALDVSQKYPHDNLWLSRNNVLGEWPVAFHGTHAGAVNDITRVGLQSISKATRDAMKKEAIQL